MKRLLSPLPIFQPAGIALVRIITGLFLVYHGKEVFDADLMKGYTTWDSFKGFSSPALMVYFGKVAELVAGILLTLGLLTRIACLMMIGVFVYITFFVGHGKFWYDDQHPFMYVLLALIFFFTGPGNWSVDALLFKRKRSYY